MVDLVNDYRRTRDANALSNIINLGLSIYENALRALLTVRGIRVRNPEHVAQVAHEFIPSGVVSNELMDLLNKCSSQPNCGIDIITSGVEALGRLLDYVHAVSTHGALHRGL